MKRNLLRLLVSLLCCSPAHSLDPSSGTTNLAASLSRMASGRIATDLTIRVGQDAPNLAAALALLDGVVIDQGAKIVVQIEPGIRTEPGTVVLDHPYGSRILVRGAPVAEVAISDASTVKGREGAYQVQLTVASTQGAAPGLYLGVTRTEGAAGHELHRGSWKVLTVDGPRNLTVANTVWQGPPPTGIRGAGILYRTVLRFNQGSGIKAASLGEISDLVIAGEGDAASIGIWGRDPTSTGVGAIVLGPRLAVVDFGAEGVRANYSGAVHAREVISSGNGNNGFMARDNGAMTALSSISSGNGGRNVPGGGNGFLAQNSGSIYASRVEAWGNAGDGLFSRSGGSLLVDNAGPTVAGKNRNGFHAAYNGFLQREGCLALANAGNGFLVETVSSLLAQRSVSQDSGAEGYLCRANAFLDASGSKSLRSGSHAYAAVQRGLALLHGAIQEPSGASGFQADRSSDIVR